MHAKSDPARPIILKGIFKRRVSTIRIRGSIHERQNARHNSQSRLL
jgi:hypothetical protein